MATQQTELPIRVVVCAWCEPWARSSGLGDVSHGICPRHLKKMTQSLPHMPKGQQSEFAAPEARRSRRTKKSMEDIAQMSFESLASFAAHA